MIRETQADRVREAKTLGDLASAWDCTYRQMPQLGLYDGELYGGGDLCAYVEAKHRTVLPTTYPSIILDEAKWRALAELGRAWLAVRFRDGSIWVTCIAGEPPDVATAGRTDRKLSKGERDREPCAHIPLSSFRREV